MDWACLAKHEAGVVLKVRVTPNAARSRAAGLTPDAGGGWRLALRVQAPPVEGQANAAVRRWVAQTFALRVSRVSILRGPRSREKDLLLAGLDSARAAEVLDELLGDPSQTDR
jgi:uncharacterized protein (TIGR00251 family)